MTHKNTGKVALGTAQFGLDYGISNTAGQVSQAEVETILARARSGGIVTVDTAAAYGSSETALGAACVSSFQVVSKLNGQAADIPQPDAVDRALSASLQRLNLTSLYGYLVHDPALLLSPQGDRIYRRMTELRDQGLVQKIGVSAYTPAEIETLSGRYDLDLVQIPLNPLDARWDDTLPALKSAGTEIHCRSIFLQGLLLMDPAKLPRHMAAHQDTLTRWHDWCRARDLSPLAACIGFMNDLQTMDKAVLGVTRRAELDQILELNAASLPEALPENLRTTQAEFLNPSLWAS